MSRPVTDVYFDTSIVSAIAKNDTPAETAPIVRILEADAADKLRLFTSDVTKEEIDRYQSGSKPDIHDFKPTMQAIYLLMRKANYVKRLEPLPNIISNTRTSRIFLPPTQDDPLWVELKKLGLKDLDAHHLMVAVKHGCHVFLTTDGDFLDNPTRKATIETRYSIRLRRPSEFAVEERL
jgi:predicted nucleic acid-binding protein